MINLTSISIHAGSTSLLHSEVDGSDYFTGVMVRARVSLYEPISYDSDLYSFQQQGYQHAGLINLCLVRYNL